MRSHFTRTLMALLASCLLVVSSLAGAKQVLRVANMGEPASLDPHFMSGTWENNIAGNMFLALLTEDARGGAIAGAAESWTVSEDGKIYTFTLRDHTWSDGVPVTAQDFEFSFRRVLDPKTAAEYASLLYIIKNAEAVNTGKLPPEELGVKALDKKTLRIELEGPAPYFLSLLTHYTAYPLPAHVVKKYGKDWTKAEHMVSNGAYTLVEWLPNTHVKLKKNPKFYDAANVAIDEIIYYPQEDRAAVLKRFRAGEVDITRDFPSDQIDWLKKNLPEETRIAPYLGTYYYPINTKKAPFNDVRVRQALSMAINREILTGKVLKTGEIPAYSFVPPGTANYGEPAYVDWKDMPYKERVKKAKALLAEAGFGPDKPLTFQLRYNTSENHKRIAIAVAQMWKQLGVKVELFNSEVKVHYADLKQGNFDVARAGWIADYNDAQNFLYLLETRTGANNYGRYSNPEYDRLMQEAEKTADLEKRADLMRQAEALAMADQPIIPIYYYVSKNLVSKRVQGWQDAVNDIHRARWMSLK